MDIEQRIQVAVAWADIIITQAIRILRWPLVTAAIIALAVVGIKAVRWIRRR